MPDPERGDAARLLDAAELSFAARGVHGPSIREITLAAGVKNKSAVHYHFADRDGLLTAVLARRGDTLRTRRAMWWEHLVVDGVEDRLRSLCSAIVEPYCEFLDDGPGEWAYLVIANGLLSDPAQRYEDLQERFNDPLLAILIDRLITAIPVPPPLADERALVGVSGVISSVATRARRQLAGESDRELVPIPLFVANLVDMLEASLLAPVHASTRRAAGIDRAVPS